MIMKNNTKLWFAAALVLMFAAGALAGALGGYIRARDAMAKQRPLARANGGARPAPWRDRDRRPGAPGFDPAHRPGKREIREMFLSHLDEELSLNEEQRDKAGDIFDAQHEQVMALRNDMQARFQAIEEDTVAKIGAILDDKQKARLDALVRERQAMRKGDGPLPPLFMLKHKKHKWEKRRKGQ